MPPIPGPDVFDLRSEPVQMQRDIPPDPTPLDDLDTLFAGSNNWAVFGPTHVDWSGDRGQRHASAVGGSEHLVPSLAGLLPEGGATRPPKTRLDPASDRSHACRRPSMVIGSNGTIAWRLTNSGGNWSDLHRGRPRSGTQHRLYRTPEAVPLVRAPSRDYQHQRTTR